jgi:hypothetical protein
MAAMNDVLQGLEFLYQSSGLLSQSSLRRRTSKHVETVLKTECQEHGFLFLKLSNVSSSVRSIRIWVTSCCDGIPGSGNSVQSRAASQRANFGWQVILGGGGGFAIISKDIKGFNEILFLNKSD